MIFYHHLLDFYTVHSRGGDIQPYLIEPVDDTRDVYTLREYPFMGVCLGDPGQFTFQLNGPVPTEIQNEIAQLRAETMTQASFMLTRLFSTEGFFDSVWDGSQWNVSTIDTFHSWCGRWGCITKASGRVAF